MSSKLDSTRNVYVTNSNSFSYIQEFRAYFFFLNIAPGIQAGTLHRLCIIAEKKKSFAFKQLFFLQKDSGNS